MACHQRVFIGHEECPQPVEGAFALGFPVIAHLVGAGNQVKLAVSPRDGNTAIIVSVAHTVVVGDIEAAVVVGRGGVADAPLVGLAVVHQHPSCGVVLSGGAEIAPVVDGIGWHKNSLQVLVSPHIKTIDRVGRFNDVISQIFPTCEPVSWGRHGSQRAVVAAGKGASVEHRAGVGGKGRGGNSVLYRLETDTPHGCRGLAAANVVVAPHEHQPIAPAVIYMHIARVVVPKRIPVEIWSGAQLCPSVGYGFAEIVATGGAVRENAGNQCVSHGRNENAHIVVVVLAVSPPTAREMEIARRKRLFKVGIHDRACVGVVGIAHAAVVGDIQAIAVIPQACRLSEAPLVGLVAVHKHPVGGVPGVENAGVITAVVFKTGIHGVVVRHGEAVGGGTRQQLPITVVPSSEYRPVPRSGMQRAGVAGIVLS